MLAVNSLWLPKELWLLVLLYCDAYTALRLCVASRVFRNMFANMQEMWRQHYHATFADDASERFWLATYCLRLAESAKVDAKHTEIDWRRALAARKQTEINWRLGCSTRRSNLVPESKCASSDWTAAGFTACSLHLSNRLKDMMYRVPATHTDATHKPHLAWLNGAPPNSQDVAHECSNGDCCVSQRVRMPHLNIYLRACRLSRNSAENLAGDAFVIGRHDRWVLVCQNAYNVPYSEDGPYWLLLDANGTFPPCRLMRLHPFDYDEYGIDPALDAGQETAERDTVFDTTYHNACIVTSCNNRVVLCVVRGSRSILYWKVYEVTFNDSSNADALKGGHMHTLYTGHCLDAWGTTRGITDLEVYAVDKDHVYIRGNMFYYPVLTFHAVVNVTNSTGTGYSLDSSHAAGTRDGIRTFRHGWLDNTMQRLFAKLPHRRLLVMSRPSPLGPQVPFNRVSLLCWRTGATVKSYLSPEWYSARHILGDLVLLITRQGDGCLKLFDVFAGVTVRVLRDASSHLYASPDIASPVYLFESWQQDSEQHSDKEEHGATALALKDEYGSQFVRRVFWLDFMPDVVGQGV
ncbi:hypothetical protein THASP1DRAFT_29019 [Thamnocephalis sphaerospora]|uniref:F-box domain-containing protein n=1 Tax=Thamnocephalis sphaerospora TaxID=78915 RepID=A0A4P9XST6_9FUNG|nr:hypothetical protein THASP1DRAFT_29019 [Thamnocephalis sphaerospora]|eukprot:RKP09197.1 hypothetical protein THASP1DRAFT_29019 [Thamnocephalis sphaerospora]